MDKKDNLITLVVHTRDRAVKLKEILEFHGVSVVLEDVVLENCPLPLNPKKVRIPLESLQLGLKILESGDMNTGALQMSKLTGMGSTMLIPVDFSPSSILSVKVGFYLARKLSLEPVVIHSFLAPLFPSEPMAESTDFPGGMAYDEELEETADFMKIASSRLAIFRKKIEAEQKAGNLTDIKFSTSLREGIPEQVIQEYCKENHPMMVVMATRGIHKKESDLVGSVTAEVIDSCRTPVLTVPEDYSISGIGKIKNILLFCTFTDFDIITVRGLMRAFDYPVCNIRLLPVSDRPINNVKKKIDDLADYFNQSFPTCDFSADILPKGKFDESIRTLLDEQDIQLIIVPNKKSSAFSRFFRPTLAHRILFDKDIPLLVLPV